MQRQHQQVRHTLSVTTSAILFAGLLSCSSSETAESSARPLMAGQAVVKIIPGDKVIDASNIKPCIVDYGRTTMTIRTTKFGDKKSLSIIVENATSQGIFVDHVGLDANSLELLYRHSPFFALGPAYLVAHFQGKQLTGSLNPLLSADPPMDIAKQLETPVFEESVWGVILSALPLKEGFKAQLPRFSARRSDKSFITHWVEASVKKQESIKVDGRDYLCWVVNIDYLDIDFQEELWVTKEPPYLVKKKASRGPESKARKVTLIDCCL